MSKNEIHPQASVSPEAKLGAGVSIGAFAVIGPHVHLGDGCVVHLALMPACQLPESQTREERGRQHGERAEESGPT